MITTLSAKDALKLTFADLDCPPRYAVERDVSRKTLGPAVAKVAARMGTFLMPWQHVVINTAMEIDPETGYFAYGECRLTLPRQQGKTCLTIPLMGHRCMAWDGQVVTYAAQTKDAAKLKLREDHEPALRPFFGDRYTATWALNNERLRWDNGSSWGITATTASAGHGPTLDLGVLDEAWAQKDARVDQAWVPAMMTRPMSQFWIPSTMGHEDSTYFNEKVDGGRAIAESGQQRDIFYAEWSLRGENEDEPPEDPADPANWARCMPALGHTVTMGKIRQAFGSMDLAEFARAYCNIRKRNEANISIINSRHLDTLADPRSRPGHPLAFGVEVAVDQSHASIGVVGMRPDGRMHVEVVFNAPGTNWIVGKMLEFTGRWHPLAWGLDLGGPLGSIKQSIMDQVGIGKPFGPHLWTQQLDDSDHFAASRSLITDTNIHERAAATGNMRNAIRDSEIVWLGAAKQAAFAKACAGARLRPLADAYAWMRKDNAEISPLEALTLARRVYLLRKPLYDRDHYDVASSVY